MITRVFRGRSPYGLVKYLYGAGRRNEHTDAHMVASWDGNPAGLEPTQVEGFGPNVSPLVAQPEHTVHACARPPKQWVYHLVLRNEPTDRPLTDEEWAEVARDAMAEVGIAPHGDEEACRWIAVRHADEHLHVVATLAREDGRPARLVRGRGGMPADFAALRRVAHRWETKLGLYGTQGRDDATATPRPGVKETVAAERAGRHAAPRVELRHRVRAAAAATGNFAEFRERLAGASQRHCPVERCTTNQRAGRPQVHPEQLVVVVARKRFNDVVRNVVGMLAWSSVGLDWLRPAAT